jgi:hypothetical protein
VLISQLLIQNKAASDALSGVLKNVDESAPTVRLRPWFNCNKLMPLDLSGSHLLSAVREHTSQSSLGFLLISHVVL